jgi:Leucine-rich repeat (LRR) protein
MQLSEYPPLPIIIRKDYGSEEINLSRMVLKDDYILLLAEVLADLPRVTSLNVRGNKLTDRSMRPLIEVVASQHCITDLDLSENKCDSLTAKALFDLVRNHSCPLKVLKVSGADLDDEEVGIFMNAFEDNSSITDLDLSHNKFGSTGEKMVEKGRWE